ncbi:unnamed protein product [Rangifer tarandus platyrhynchus]|uniref:Uncharacterized protein n=1 Tax=Rangifer tarandus platyrhynchus TaxID=3082113 RepID=A0AC59ZCE4_RANTA
MCVCVCVCARVCVCVNRSVVCDSLRPHGLSLPGSPVHGTLQEEHWCGLPFSSLGDLPGPGPNPALPRHRQILCHLSQCGMIDVYLHTSHLLYSFICQGTSGLFPGLDCCK